jgi:hypothetical protein
MGRAKELISELTIRKQTLERQKGREQLSNKPLPEARQVVDHRTHLLSQ